jgi:rod shape-determining protein MreD
MMEARLPNGFFILLFLLLAFPLSVFPLPLSLQWWRPEFLALFAIYFALEAPEKFGVILAWCAGLFLDIVEGNILGQSAIALSVIVYIVLLQYQRIRMFSVLQQMALVGMLVAISQLVSYWVQALSDQPAHGMQFLQSALSSALCWPIVVLVMHRLKHLFGFI